MTQTQTQAIETVWFIYSEAGKPLGRLYRGKGALEPVIGAPMPDEYECAGATIIAVRELAPTCAMRRFHVTVRQSAAD